MFELLIIATAASALSQRLFGFEARWLWTLAFGALTVVLAFLGPIGFVRRYVRKFAGWVVLGSLLYLTWWTLHGAHLHGLWARHGQGGLPFWAAVDLVLASIVSWTPLAADYTRFSRSRRSAFWGVGLGYLVPTLWLFPMGALLLLSRNLSDPAALPAAVAAGGPRVGARARSAHRRRVGRGVRERLLDRRLDPEPLARASRSGS